MAQETSESESKIESFLRNKRSTHAVSHVFPDAETAWDQIFDALAPHATLTVASMIARVTQKWVETGNPYFLDFACMLCQESSVPIPPPLRAGLAVVAHQRLTGATPGGTPLDVRRELLLEEAFELIAHLVAFGLTLRKAAIKTIRTLPSVPKMPKLAGVLERHYSESKWPSLEVWVAERLEDDDVKAHWARRAEELPDADEELWGNRH